MFDTETLKVASVFNALQKKMADGKFTEFESIKNRGRYPQTFDGIVYDGSHTVCDLEDEYDKFEMVWSAQMDVKSEKNLFDGDEVKKEVLCIGSTYSDLFDGMRILLCMENGTFVCILAKWKDPVSGETAIVEIDGNGWRFI